MWNSVFAKDSLREIKLQAKKLGIQGKSIGKVKAQYPESISSSLSGIYICT